MKEDEILVSEEDTQEVLEEQGMPQNPEDLGINPNETSVTNNTLDNTETEDKVVEINSVGQKGSPIAKRNLNYSCRTTCRQNVVIVTVMKDGTEDCLTFVCNLNW